MKVTIKKFAVDMALKYKGIELDVYDGDKHLGDLVIRQTGVIWCPGKKAPKNGLPAKWKELIELLKNKNK